MLINKYFSSLFGLCFLFSPALYAAEVPQAITFPINSFKVEGQSPLSDAEMNILLSSFEGKRYSLTDLQDVSKQIEHLLRDAGFAFYRIVLPPQSLAGGEVTFKIVSFTVGEIEISGNQFFNSENIFASIPHLIADESPNTQTLAQQIKVANHNTDKQISVIFKQSDAIDKITAKVDVADLRPYHYSLIINNQGSDDSGNARVTAAYQHNNLWNKDHTLNLSYTTSPNHTSDVQQYGISYAAPIYKSGGWLSAYYTKSDVDTGRVSIGGDAGLDVSGSGEIFGLHYLQFFKKIEQYEHALDIGIDNRLFDNKIILTSGNTSLGDIATDVRSVPLTITYKGNFTFPTINIGHHISWSKNLGMGSENNSDAYAASRFGAKQEWDLVRYGLFANIDNKGWLYRVSLKGQYSNEPLISGEQFGLGGTYSIRGYDEREVSSDVGNSLSFEAFTPQWNNAKLLAFYDYGKGRNHQAQPGEKHEWNLASIGIGLRWQWQRNIQLTADIGHTLKDANTTSKNHTHAHASLILQY